MSLGRALIRVTMASAASLLNSALSGTLTARCWTRTETALHTGAPPPIINTRTNLDMVEIIYYYYLSSKWAPWKDVCTTNKRKTLLRKILIDTVQSFWYWPESVGSDHRESSSTALPHHQYTRHQVLENKMNCSSPLPMQWRTQLHQTKIRVHCQIGDVSLPDQPFRD